MPFIGNQPALSYTSFSKQDFTTSATTSYTLDNPVANANELALFINFVRQEPTTAYSASSTTLTLTSATSSSDDMYCVFLGKAVQTVNPPNASVGLSQLTATGTKDATTFLRGDNTFAAAGITEADCWRMTTDVSGSGADLTSWERDDDAAAGYLGTGMSQSSGIFTFPTTGIWYVNFNCTVYHTGGGMNFYTKLDSTINNSTYSEHARARAQQPSGSYGNMTGSCNAIIDVTNTSNVKVKFSFYSGVTSAYVQGNSDINITAATFIRLGST
tara:strand:- start:61 stop:876 length:816 start_codon:yes stop_codon:yes gene_type:complete